MREFNAYKCTVKERNSIRPELTGVYHTEGLKVAVDGHIMAVIKSEYPSEYEGKIVTNKGVIINEKFPLFRSIIPNILRSKKHSIDLVKLGEAIEEAKIEFKVNKLTYIAITEDLNIRLSHAKLLLLFLKIYKTKQVLTNIPKNKNHLPTLVAQSGDSTLLCTHVASFSKHTIVRNNITTRV